MQYMMGACLAYAILFLLMGAVGVAYAVLRAVKSMVMWAMRQRRK